MVAVVAALQGLRRGRRLWRRIGFGLLQRCREKPERRRAMAQHVRLRWCDELATLCEETIQEQNTAVATCARV